MGYEVGYEHLTSGLRKVSSWGVMFILIDGLWNGTSTA